MIEKLLTLKRDKKAQLVFATTIALVFIVLIGITTVNMSSYTTYKQETSVDKNLDVVQQAETTEYAIEQSIMHTNHHENIDGYNDKEDQIEDDIVDDGGIEPTLDDQFHRVGGRVDISVDSHEKGTRIWRPRYGNLTNQDGSTEYNLTDSSNVRAFTVTVRDIQSGDTDFSFGEPNNPDYDIEISEDGSGRLRVYNTSSNEECRTQYGYSDPAQISFTQGSIDTITCEALPGTTNLDAVSVSNTENIDASLNMVVDEANYNEDVQSTNGDGSASYNPLLTNPIQEHEAIYSTTMSITTATPKSTLTTEMTVTPQTSLEAKQ